MSVSWRANGYAVLGDFVSGKVSRNPLHARSEEHTSELQSHSDLVCRLLLEKKIDVDRRIQADMVDVVTEDLVLRAQHVVDAAEALILVNLAGGEYGGVGSGNLHISLHQRVG